jgi:hypothetical protein
MAGAFRPLSRTVPSSCYSRAADALDFVVEPLATICRSLRGSFAYHGVVVNADASLEKGATVAQWIQYAVPLARLQIIFQHRCAGLLMVAKA